MPSKRIKPLTPTMEEALKLAWCGLPTIAIKPRTGQGLANRGYLDENWQLTPRAEEWAASKSLAEQDKRQPELMMLDSLPDRQLRAFVIILRGMIGGKSSGNYPYIARKGLVKRVAHGVYQVKSNYRKAWGEWYRANKSRVNIIMDRSPDEDFQPEKVAKIMRPVLPQRPTISEFLGDRYAAALQGLSKAETARVYQYYNRNYEPSIRSQPDNDALLHEIRVYIDACLQDEPMGQKEAA